MKNHILEKMISLYVDEHIFKNTQMWINLHMRHYRFPDKQEIQSIEKSLPTLNFQGFCNLINGLQYQGESHVRQYCEIFKNAIADVQANYHVTGTPDSKKEYVQYRLLSEYVNAISAYSLFSNKTYY